LALALVAVVAAVGVLAVEDDWVDPAYADSDASGESFLEDGTSAKLRGVSHTVSPRKGMVTYISPARHLATSGIVLPPPPTVSVTHVEHAHAFPIAAVAPFVEEPYYFPPVPVPVAVPAAVNYMVHEDTHPVHHHHASLHPVVRRGHIDRHVHVLGPRGVVATAIDQMTPTASVAEGGFPIRVGGNGFVHTYSPEYVPASLATEPYHARHSLSKGPILVPHGPSGAIAMEGAAFAGYNPGPRYKYHSVPTAYYSDGRPHLASITKNPA